ncbi:MAG: MMPL family transporter [Mycobacterium sp.]|uniref:efflux RND transporter permease subunit n=1 Tax=Mycobacterium sp. TaxID=1785 RepID=UPI001EC0F895|nr:MMPL family transporter [Mycobacterium sp.]MBV8787546.1 MMPL family transporter [Mycobacterium sp.]
MFNLRIDMSFRPVFTGNQLELQNTRRFESIFGIGGFNELSAIVDVGNAKDPDALMAVTELADELGRLPDEVDVRDPLAFPYVDSHGAPHPSGLRAELATARSQHDRQAMVEELVDSPPARRIVFGDSNRRLAVTAQFRIATSQFREWHKADKRFHDVVQTWSARHGIAVMVTGYPDVEQVYAHEVLISVLRSIGVLVVAMLVVLFIYFRRVRDVVVCLAGVTLAVPIVLGAMYLLGQPFSIVNSQVLTLVVIVGIAEALHHQQEYRRRREAGRDHETANREAFSILAWPAFMTGLATVAGFAALLTADMAAIWSFGLCTSVGVIVVYLVNWITVPALIHVLYQRADLGEAPDRRSWTMRVLMWSNRLAQGRPWAVVVTFLAVTAGVGVVGISNLSVDQKVNEELPAVHPSVIAQSVYEHEFTGFLGPDLWIRPRSNTLIGQDGPLTRLVNRVCDLPDVRFVASPLDLVPQPASVGSQPGKYCHRRGGDVRQMIAARSGVAGPQPERLAAALIDQTGTQGAILIRAGDMGTAKSISFARQMLAIAREEMPDAQIELVGQWWLAQQGMRSLSVEMMLSAVTALLLILPTMAFAIRDGRLFCASIVPTTLPVVAALGFMGLVGITVRIGTAMILAISLGLAADDTVHLSVRIRERILAGCDAGSAVIAVLRRTGRPASFSSYVLIVGFATMILSSLVALREMGLVAAFTMAYVLLSDLLLAPAIFLLLARREMRGMAPSWEIGVAAQSLQPAAAQ